MGWPPRMTNAFGMGTDGRERCRWPIWVQQGHTVNRGANRLLCLIKRTLTIIQAALSFARNLPGEYDLIPTEDISCEFEMMSYVYMMWLMRC